MKINELLVEKGWASNRLPESKRLVALDALAREEKKGIWQSKRSEPAEPETGSSEPGTGQVDDH